MKEEASKAVPGMPHHLVLEDRRALTVSGVSDVDSFDELTVIIYTDLGELTVKGEGLHINRLNPAGGVLRCVPGDPAADAALRQGGLFSGSPVFCAQQCRHLPFRPGGDRGGAAFLSVPGPRYRLYGLLFYHRPGGDALRQERHRRDSVAVARPLEGDFFPVPPSLETFTPSHLRPGSIFL